MLHYGAVQRCLLLVAFLSSIFIAVPSSACPLINGLIDYNCDGQIKILFTGDSYAKGFGDKALTDTNGGYALDVAQELGSVVVTNLGVAGATAGTLLNAFKSNLIKGKLLTTSRAEFADIIIIDIGRNSYWRGHPPRVVIGKLRRLVKFLRQFFVENYFSEPLIAISTNANIKRSFQQPYIDELNKAFRKAKSKNFPLYLFFDKLKAKSVISGDLLHPHSRGYKRLSKIVLKFIRNKAQQLMAKKRSDADVDGIYDQLEPTKFLTDPLLPDTDTDGLYDGVEVFTYTTSPIVPDTDGDGASDGAEVSAGTNPLDPLT